MKGRHKNGNEFLPMDYQCPAVSVQTPEQAQSESKRYIVKPPVCLSLLSTHPCPVQKSRRSKLGKEKDFLVSARPRMRACSAATPIFSSRPFPLRNKTFCGEGKMRRHPERTEEGGRFRHCGRRQNCEARAFPAAATEEIKRRGRLDISEQNFSSELSFGRGGSRM